MEFGIFFKIILTVSFMRKSWRHDRHFTLKFRVRRFEKYPILKVYYGEHAKARGLSKILGERPKDANRLPTSFSVTLSRSHISYTTTPTQYHNTLLSN